MTKVMLIIYFGISCFYLGKFSYVDSDGMGIFLPKVGGYHLSLVDNEESGVYR